ncbi:hypothetical protein Tco_0008585 [Tanacetum coccineum]
MNAPEKLTCRRTCQVRRYHQNSEEAGMSKDISGDEGLSSGETKLNSIFITAEVTFTKPKERSADDLPTTKKRDDKLRVNCENGRGPNTCLLCKPTDTRNRNMLHSDGKNYARNDLNGKVPEDDFPETESPCSNGSPNRGNVSNVRCRRTIVKWETGLRTYDISYIAKKEVEGQVVRKFLEQEEQVLHALAGHEEGTPDEETNSYAIRLNCYVFEESMDYEALLASLVAYVRKGMKDLHVFVNSKELVDQVEGHKVPKTMEARRYREEVMEATAPFHRSHLVSYYEQSAEGTSSNPHQQATIHDGKSTVQPVTGTTSYAAEQQKIHKGFLNMVRKSSRHNAAIKPMIWMPILWTSDVMEHSFQAKISPMANLLKECAQMHSRSTQSRII